MRFPLVSRWIFVFIRKKTGEAGLSCVSINPRPCHSEPVTDVTGVGIRNLLAGNLRKSAGIMRFGNGLPRQSVPQGHLLRGADWLAMTRCVGGGVPDVPYARFTAPVCRAGPMCPAAEHRICPGGAHGPRPTRRQHRFSAQKKKALAGFLFLHLE